MKKSVILLFAALATPLPVWADGTCLSTQQERRIEVFEECIAEHGSVPECAQAALELVPDAC